MDSLILFKVLMCYYYFKASPQTCYKKKNNQYRHDVSDSQPASPPLLATFTGLFPGTHQGCYCLWAFALSHLSTWNDFFFFGFLVAGFSYHLES